MRVSGGHLASLLCIGDSLTASAGASTNSATYPAVVAASSPRGRDYRNLGVGGETSTQIATRLLALTAPELLATTIIWAGRNNYGSGATVKADIAAMVAALGHSRYLVLSILNSDTALEYAGAANYVALTTLNAGLAAIYGARYCDVRGPLVAAGAPAGSAPDATNYARDVPASGLRSDALHLNDAGYALAAATIYAKLVAVGI